MTAIQTAGADGIILAGPSAQRPASLASPNMHEVGGLSGEPVKDLSTEAIKKVYSMTRGNIPLIGVGGIASGEDAYKRIRAGASLVQVRSRHLALVRHRCCVEAHQCWSVARSGVIFAISSMCKIFHSCV